MEARVARRGVNKGNSQRERERGRGGGGRSELVYDRAPDLFCFPFHELRASIHDPDQICAGEEGHFIISCILSRQ